MALMTWEQEFGAYAAILGLTQLFVAFRFFLLLRREAATPPAEYAPAATLIVPCKGVVEGFEENIRSLLDQDYKGPLEVLFVVPSENDPACARLRSWNARVLVSNLVPRSCSGKALDLLHALDHISPGSEILVFADSDIRVRRDWLAQLVAPLSDSETVVTTAAMLFLPGRGFWTLLRAVWMAAGIPYSALMQCVTGQSLAIRRFDFDGLGVRGVWGSSFMEDLSLAALLRSRGKRVRYVSRAMPFSTGACGVREYFSVFNKWMVTFRIYDIRVWIPALIATAAHLHVVFWSLYPRTHWGIVGLLFGGDAAYLACVFLIYRRFLPYRPLPLWAALTAPLLWATYAVQVAQSLWVREIRWGGRLYRIHGPQDVEVMR